MTTLYFLQAFLSQAYVWVFLSLFWALPSLFLVSVFQRKLYTHTLFRRYYWSKKDHFNKTTSLLLGILLFLITGPFAFYITHNFLSRNFHGVMMFGVASFLVIAGMSFGVMYYLAYDNKYMIVRYFLMYLAYLGGAVAFTLFGFVNAGIYLYEQKRSPFDILWVLESGVWFYIVLFFFGVFLFGLLGYFSILRYRKK